MIDIGEGILEEFVERARDLVVPSYSEIGVWTHPRSIVGLAIQEEADIRRRKDPARKVKKLEYNKKYRAVHRKELLERKREYYSLHSEELCERKRNAYALKKGNACGN